MTDNPRDFPSPFYTEAEPCENCGEPTFRGRVWNPEHGLWIGTDCQCNTPEQPTCPNLAPLIAQANTVHEIVRVCKKHRALCALCGPVEIRRPSNKEPAKIEREAA